MDPVIETVGLTMHYGARRGIDSVTLSVNEAEVFGFLGPNGAGHHDHQTPVGRDGADGRPRYDLRDRHVAEGAGSTRQARVRRQRPPGCSEI